MTDLQKAAFRLQIEKLSKITPMDVYMSDNTKPTKEQHNQKVHDLCRQIDDVSYWLKMILKELV